MFVVGPLPEAVQWKLSVVSGTAASPAFHSIAF